MNWLIRLRFSDTGFEDLVSSNSWTNTTVTFNNTGKFGEKSALFNNSRLKLNKNIDLGTSDFTLSAWVKSTGSNQYGDIIGSADNKCKIGLASKLYIQDTSQVYYLSKPNTMFDGNWHHFACVRKNLVFYLYIDGKLDAAINSYTGNFTFVTPYIGGVYQYFLGELDDICLIKDTALWTGEFIPPTSYLLNKYIAYLTSDNKLYGKVNNVFTKLSDNYSGMSTADAKAAILSTGRDYAAIADLQTIGVFKGLLYDDTNSTPSSAMTVINNDTILTPIELISLKSIEGIDKVSVNKSISGTGACRLAVTTDLATYKTFNGTEFVNIDISNISTFKTTGITPDVLASITREKWDTLTVGKSGIGFAYLPTIEEITDTCSITDISITADMKGEWNSAIKGTDFKYGYPANDRLKVTLLTTGNYKINYVGG